MLARVVNCHDGLYRCDSLVGRKACVFVVDASAIIAFCQTERQRRLAREEEELPGARLGIDPDQCEPVPTIRIEAIKAGKFAVPSAQPLDRNADRIAIRRRGRKIITRPPIQVKLSE